MILDPLISALSTDQVRRLVLIISSSERAKTELFQSKPKARALELLGTLKAKLTINSHLVGVDQALTAIQAM